ncbi:hypothetical protein EMIHUDRAFT_96057 [Emiliania huxleyi CCMP1516]|uniref:Helicase MOV-10-like beta-barrel domain-containing protein n=2 Tax=Emiliania huxleyi TaxID=2903 RepID=A0A0D3J471_EMIH1|nr:hypothetical protein EMIHUDRAFT_96057 [Emiliania huxleyi CCMP1516]EOD18306.1 hypothetical protein EMIHUDRAFT_96057 [Emiliania huxleyi CCMP1516]|eukprot:XP_005770735.1 hypothetical protein EMIHUDRAFT_96057 [Emiliania huxleyi CCMP1516]
MANLGGWKPTAKYWTQPTGKKLCKDCVVGRVRQKLGDDDAEIKRRFRAIFARKGHLLVKAGISGYVTFGYEREDSAEEDEDEAKAKKAKTEDGGASGKAGADQAVRQPSRRLHSNTQGGDKVQLTSLGKVPKPHGLQRKLKSVIKQHPAIFTLYEGAVSGGAETVSLVVTPSPPAAVPPQPASPSSQGPPVAATEEHTVIAFGQQLRADDALRARCAKKDAFKAEYAAWKARELTDGRKWRGAAATVLFRLWRFSAAQGARLGVVRIKAVVGQRVYFAAIGAMAALAESVVEQRDVMEKDKFGVRVTPLHVFEGGLIVRRGAAVQRTLVVENASDEMRELAGASFLQRGPGPFSSSFTGEDGALVLTPGGKVTLTLTCRPILSGMCNNVLNLNFGHFGIARFLEVRCGDADAITDLAPTRPYQRRPRRRPPPPTKETEVVEAPPLGSSSFGGAAANTRRAQAGKLPLYRIPGSLRAAVGSGEAGEALEAACEQMKRLLGGVSEAAALAAYKKAFHELLWVEEMQLNDDLREFDLRADDATVLTPRGRLFALEVRGLAENRPSVLKGDVIKANFPGGSTSEILPDDEAGHAGTAGAAVAAPVALGGIYAATTAGGPAHPPQQYRSTSFFERVRFYEFFFRLSRVGD